MSELPESFLQQVQARREELMSHEHELENLDAKKHQQEEEYKQRIRQVGEWARVLGPLAAAKQIATDAVIFSERKDFPVWYVTRERNDGNPDDRLDLSRSPTQGSFSNIWIGVVMDKKGRLFYFKNTDDTRTIDIDNISLIDPEKIQYRGLENLNDVDGHGQGIGGIEKSLADFAIRHDLVSQQQTEKEA